MIVPVMAISNLVLTQQIYSEETNGAHAHYREPVPLRPWFSLAVIICPFFFLMMTQRPPSKIKRQDKALEAYQAACAKYEKERWTPLDWIESSTKLNSKAKKTSRTQTTPWRSTTGCTTMNRLRLPANQSSLSFAQCSPKTRRVNFVGTRALALGYAAFRFLQLLQYHHTILFV